MSLLFTSGGQSIRASASSSSPSNEYSGLISFRIDWFHLLAVWRTLRSLLQHHDSKALILQHFPFFKVQLLHPYMTTGKTIALTIWTSMGKVMSLLFNMLSRLVIPFLPRSECLVISWLQSPLSITNSRSSLKLMSIQSVMLYNHLIFCCPLLFLSSVFPSMGVFSNESALCIRWPKCWSFSFSISPSSEYLGLTGLISLQSKGLSRVFSNNTVQKHQFFGTHLSLWSNSHIHTHNY